MPGKEQERVAVGWGASLIVRFCIDSPASWHAPDSCNLHPQAMNQRATSKAGPRLSKMPQLHDFQFYNVPRLTELYDKEHAYEIHKHQVGPQPRALLLACSCASLPSAVLNCAVICRPRHR